MSTEKLQALVEQALDDIKADDVQVIDVRDTTSITDLMIIATGSSTRHVRSVADTVIEKVKKAGYKILSMEGEQACDWVLVDIGDIVLHVMLPDVREFYALEKLWTVRSEEQVADQENENGEPLDPDRDMTG